MKTRSFIITLLLLLAVLPSKAVLKERNLAGTLAMLRIELTEYRHRNEKTVSPRSPAIKIYFLGIYFKKGLAFSCKFEFVQLAS